MLILILCFGTGIFKQSVAGWQLAYHIFVALPVLKTVSCYRHIEQSNEKNEYLSVSQYIWKIETRQKYCWEIRAFGMYFMIGTCIYFIGNALLWHFQMKTFINNGIKIILMCFIQMNKTMIGCSTYLLGLLFLFTLLYEYSFSESLPKSEMLLFTSILWYSFSHESNLGNNKSQNVSQKQRFKLFVPPVSFPIPSKLSLLYIIYATW